MPKKKLYKMYSKRNVSKCAQKKEISNVPQMDAFKVKKKKISKVCSKKLCKMCSEKICRNQLGFFQILSKRNLPNVLKIFLKLLQKETFENMPKNLTKGCQNKFSKICSKKVFSNVLLRKSFKIYQKNVS